MVHISKHQLFTLMFIFEIGSTTLFALGIEAKQDAWLAILIALFIGLGFVWIYTQLQKSFPHKDFVDLITSISGKTLGLPLAFLYLLAWLRGVSRNLREFGELIILTTLPNSPLWIICLLFLAVSVYTLLKGMEVLARISEIILPII
ncbi:MAG: spore germination protein, partial [Bacillota bacterium]|nr:spore germination protein [Bacillota bacterium]